MTDFSEAPVAIGGIGGSGTRVLAELLRLLGYHIGDDLNGSHDNLWFTLLFKRRSVLFDDDDRFGTLASFFACRMIGPAVATKAVHDDILALASRSRIQHSQDWLQQRATSLLSHRSTRQAGQPWGWKEPNTHIVINRLLRLFPRLKYIHAVRNPLDMAFSGNQNQLETWGPVFLDFSVEQTPRKSLAYWCCAHRRMEALRTRWPDRVLFVDHELVCIEPETVARQTAAYLSAKLTSETVQAFASYAQRPMSFGRGAGANPGLFDDADLAYVRRLGYSCRDSFSSRNRQPSTRRARREAARPFIVCCPRSGSTLLTMMFNAHPRMAIPPETHFFPQILTWRNTNILPRNWGDFAARVVTSQRWRDFGLDSEEFTRAAMTREQTFSLGAGLAFFFEYYAKHAGREFWGDKTPGHIFHMNEILSAVPTARFIHIVRDGRDVFSSIKNLYFGPSDPETGAGYWLERLSCANAFRAANSERIVEVRYEDLVADPRGVLTKLCDFIELDFVETMLTNYPQFARLLQALPDLGSGDTLVSGSTRRAIHAMTQQPISDAKIGRYRLDLTSEEIATFESIASAALTRHGYELSRTASRSAPIQSRILPASGDRT